MLLTDGLHVNESKTERYHIKTGGEDSWKKCKYLGLLLKAEGKDFQLIHARHSNLFSSASKSVEKSREEYLQYTSKETSTLFI